MPKRTSAASAATPHPLISNERLQHLYVTLLRAQLLRARNRLRKNSAPLVAREAIVTGTVTHLEDDDKLMPVAGDQLGSRKLKAWFIDRKIPRPERRRIPLLAVGRHVLEVCAHVH